MSNIGKTLVKGHTLRGEGAPHHANGERIITNWVLGVSGRGRGKCSCGSLSDELPSATARRRWHREHKDEVRVAGES